MTHDPTGPTASVDAEPLELTATRALGAPAGVAPRRPRVGVALGGGSARGYAHIGVLAALARHGVRPDVLVGASFGAVVGALVATGRDLGALRAEAGSLRRRDVFPHVVDVGLGRGALVAGDRLEAYYDRLLDGRRFEDCITPLAVVATDLDTGERVTLRSGSLARALRASSALPGLIAPVVVDGRRLVDGGIGAPVPLETLKGEAVDVAIGVGAGVEVRDSAALRTARGVLRGRGARRVRAWLGRRTGPGSAGALAGALALTVDAWTAASDALDEGADAAVHVQTRPPISWLRFDLAERAIAAGELALDAAWPRLDGALRAVRGSAVP